MPNYKHNIEVPWKEILKILHWYLQMRVKDYRNSCNLAKNEIAEQSFVEMARQNVKCGYLVYSRLRRFLGYQTKTKLEETARNILRDLL